MEILTATNPSFSQIKILTRICRYAGTRNWRNESLLSYQGSYVDQVGEMLGITHQDNVQSYVLNLYIQMRELRIGSWFSLRSLDLMRVMHASRLKHLLQGSSTISGPISNTGILLDVIIIWQKWQVPGDLRSRATVLKLRHLRWRSLSHPSVCGSRRKYPPKRALQSSQSLCREIQALA